MADHKTCPPHEWVETTRCGDMDRRYGCVRCPATKVERTCLTPGSDEWYKPPEPPRRKYRIELWRDMGRWHGQAAMGILSTVSKNHRSPQEALEDLLANVRDLAFNDPEIKS